MKFYAKLLVCRNLESLIDLSNQYVFHGDLEKIIEVTYTYRPTDEGWHINETIFEEYLGLSYPKYSLESLGRKYRYKIWVQLVYIDDILKKLQKIRVDSRSASLKRGIFIDALEYVKIILEISLLALPFELQKAGEDILLSPTKIKLIITKIEKKERFVFWKQVLESKEEFSHCYNFVTKNHDKKSKKLSSQDRKLMKKILKKIKESAKCELVSTPDISKKNLRAPFLKKEIQRKDYRKIFDAVCELYELPQRTKITNAW